MKRDIENQIGSFLSRELRCDSCGAFYVGLNFLPQWKIEQKQTELIETLIRISDGAWTEHQITEAFTRACKDEHRIRGMGDVIHRAARVLGIRKKRNCGCGKRRAKLNRIIPFARSTQ